MAVWYDPDVTLAAVLAELRLAGGDVDEERLRALIPTAAADIDDYLDRVDPTDGPPPDPLLQEGLQIVVIDMYRDQPAGAAELAGLAVPVAATVYDPLSRARPLLIRRKQRFGVG